MQPSTVQARTTTRPCEIHKRHDPRPHRQVLHHVWPLGLGGPDIDENQVAACDTGHYSVHTLLDAWRKAKGDPGYQVRRGYARREQELARIGYLRYAAQRMDAA